MTGTPLLTYWVLRTLDNDAADELFDRLTLSGLGSFCGVARDNLWELMFDFSCGCDECPHPAGVEEAREIVEGALRAEGLEFELVEVELCDDDGELLGGGYLLPGEGDGSTGSLSGAEPRGVEDD